MYLDYAETQAKKHNAMTMEEWINKLNLFLKFNEREVLENSGTISSSLAKETAYKEYDKYRENQDKMMISDFDEYLYGIENKL